jgi:hypothetical protein
VLTNYFDFLNTLLIDFGAQRLTLNLVFSKEYVKFALPFGVPGGLAHLVERKHGMFEVIGSSPISSTKRKRIII